jgi:serralysin
MDKEHTMHFYTTDITELTNTLRNGATFEGVACYVFNSSTTSGVRPVQRLVGGQDHFYTINADEALNAISQFGYKEEEVAFFAFPTEQANTTPFFRRRNVNTGEHFYTASSDEAQAVLGEGFEDEGICCFVYVPGTAPGGTVPLYRVFIN